MELGDVARGALAAREIWYLATIGPDGAPQVTPVWADLRDGLILVNTPRPDGLPARTVSSGSAS